MTEKEIKRKVNKLRKELGVLNQNLEDIFQDKHYPELKKLEGKYFKYEDSYGGKPSRKKESWFIYTKVLKIDKESIYDASRRLNCFFNGMCFSVNTQSVVNIELNYSNYMSCLGVEISKEEFDIAYSDTLSLINDSLKQ